LRKKNKKKLVYHIADFYADSRGEKYSILKKMIKKLEFSIINTCDTTIICTEERKKQIAGSNPNNLSVIHNTPIYSVSHNNQRHNTNIKLTYVGALTKNRFILNIVDAINTTKEIDFTIAGSGSLEKKLREMKSEFITYLGKVDYSEALGLIKSSDLMIAMYDPKIRNHFYAAPNKIYESITFGIPIIVAKNTGLSSIVEKYNFGWVIDYNTESLLEVLNEIIHNPHVLETKSNNTRNAYEIYNWNNTKLSIQNIYSRLE
jgi:glycosyltransferase involved in cell wall biosynthesis